MQCRWLMRSERDQFGDRARQKIDERCLFSPGVGAVQFLISWFRCYRLWTLKDSILQM